MARRTIRLTSHRAGVLLVFFSFLWGIYLVKIQLDDRTSRSEYIKDRILTLSKEYIQALAREKGALNAIDGSQQSEETLEMKKATAVLLQSMLDRIQHLESQVESVITNSTSKFELLVKQIKHLNSSITNNSNRTRGKGNRCVIPNDSRYPDCKSRVEWMQENWKKDAKYAQNGVNGSLCTILHYLSKVERMCPEKFMEHNFLPKHCEVPRDPGFPDCTGKVEWMQKFWTSDSKFVSHGVDGSLCSILMYLSEVESWCPLIHGRTPNRDCAIPADKSFPDCTAKIAWMSNFWKSDPCYEKDHGVNGTICSFIVYLSEVENFCPRFPNRKVVQKTFTGPTLEPVFDRNLEGLLALLADPVEIKFRWMKNRIRSMWQDWQEALRHLRKVGKLNNTTRKKILVHIGVLAEESRLHFAENAFKGGPLGELVQWSDAISTLYLLGHDLTVTANTDNLKSALGSSTAATRKCPAHVSNEFHLVYVDYYGIKQMTTKIGALMPHFKCKLRVVDSFGTEAQFNYNSYSEKVPGGSMGQWGRHNLDLRQYMTMFPHSPDNTFLGFVVSKEQGSNQTLPKKKDQALVYGKHISMWTDKNFYHEFLDVVNKYYEVHATVGGGSQDELQKALPHYVVNHGVLPQADLKNLLQESKVFIGLGFPYEGPAPLEAIANACFFVNPRFDPPHSREVTPFLSNKPTLRKVTSQNPYMEDFVGKPWVYTIDVKNHGLVEEAIKDIVTKEATPYMPREFTHVGMLERLSAYVQNQDFCSKKQWPSLKALKLVKAEPDQSCKEVCRIKGLVCEPAFFPHINSKESLTRSGFPCGTSPVEYTSSLVAPGYRPQPPACILQTQSLMYSCTASSPSTRRLCPCRDFIRGQVALCPEC